MKPSGLYYDGFVLGKELDDILEHHRRDTASTFGTRKSSNVSASLRASTPKSSDHTTKAPYSDENVNEPQNSVLQNQIYIVVHS